MAARRKTVRPRKKARSAAQKAATRRMLAANRAKRGGRDTRPSRSTGAKRRRRTAKRASPAAAAPARRRRTAKRSSAPAKRRRRSASRGMRFGGSGGIVNQAVGMAKDGAIMGVGALGIDVLQGQLNKFLPTGWDTPMNGTEVNYKNAAVKAALSVAVGYAGQRFLPASMRQIAMKAAMGSLVIQAYTVAKGTLGTYLPDSTPLGYVPMPRQQMRGVPRPMIPLSVSSQGSTLNGAPLNKQAFYQPRY